MLHAATIQTIKQNDGRWLLSLRYERVNAISYALWSTKDKAMLSANDIAADICDRFTHECRLSTVEFSDKRYAINVYCDVVEPAYDVWALQTGAAK